MEIIWHGHSFFEITGKTEEGKVNIAIDPYDESIGIIPPQKVEADILLVSHQHPDHSNIKIIKGDYFLIDSPGEYEVKGVFIKGIPSFHDNEQGKKRGANIIFLIEFEKMKICHLGDLGETQIFPEVMEEIFGADVLFIPVGGNFTISGKEAAKLVSQIEPKIAIPMHYKIPGLKLDLEDEKAFLRTLGIKEKEKEKRLKITKEKLKSEGTEIVLLSPR
ncbi:MAG TPA: MBL fold metallo-hydrolase [Candidatus Pacearchaeota archaeon]|nr:MBL fold metallo-hydrolase [Candidatus Pacearchaeota archaeon]HOK94011.1 MBL fold metallo-hydrolase [Candidatus Pacearchaeota archaeon]HPO75082.1 MBL fold metallo-hydrolase [Candidatus Pacearchaeota archaeon]